MEIRRRNFIKSEQMPYKTCLGWEIDSGQYHMSLQKVLDAVDYDGLRREQEEKRAKGELMGIGLVTFTEIVGAGPSRNCDILGIGMFDSAEIRVHPTGSAIARMGTITQGQGHQTTYAQIIASELGLPSEEIQIEEVILIPHLTVWVPMARALHRLPVLQLLLPRARSKRKPRRLLLTCSR